MLPMSEQPQSDAGVQALHDEIARLNKVVQALMNRSERNASLRGSDFNLFQTAITLEDQVRHRTAELEAAMRENEKITRALRESENRIRQLAFHDALTQLANRRLLTDRLGQAMAASKRSGRYGAVMFLDLDNFKPLNDKFGHKAGDLFLVEVAHRLTRCVREVDTVARFGGDEFVVVLSELAGSEPECAKEARIVAEKIHVALTAPYLLTPFPVGTTKMITHLNVGASIGVALFHNDASAEDILKWADKAMYRAKESGRNQISFHDSGS